MAGPRYSILPLDAVLDRRLTHLALHVLAVLGGHSDNNGWCIVRLKTIAQAIGSDASKVSKAITLLVELGYVRKRERYGKNGGQLANLYQVSLDREPVDVDADDGVEAVAEVDGGEVPEQSEAAPLVLRTSPPWLSGQAPLGHEDKPFFFEEERPLFRTTFIP